MEDELLENILENQDKKLTETNQLLENVLENGDSNAKDNLKKQDEIIKKVSEKPEVQKMELEGIKTITLKGENGKTPIKGKDYYTPEEIADIVKKITNEIRIPEDGKTPEKGKDYFTNEEIRSVVNDVFSLIYKPKDGKDGKDGADVIIDYEMIIAEVLVRLPKQKKVKQISADEIYKKIKGLISYKDLKDVPNFYKGKLAGAGYLREITDVEISDTPTDGQALVYNASKKQWIPATISSGTVENLSSQCNGSTTVFTTTSNTGIIWLTLNGTMLIEGKEFTRDTATQITLTFAPETGEELYLKYI